MTTSVTLIFSDGVPAAFKARVERDSKMGLYDPKKGGLYFSPEGGKMEAVYVVTETEKKCGEEYQQLGAEAVKTVARRFGEGEVRVEVVVEKGLSGQAAHIQKGAYLASLAMDDALFKSKKKKGAVKVTGIPARLKEVLDAVHVTRVLTSTPANILNTETYITEMKRIFKPYKDIRIKILRKKELVKEKMNLLLAVGAASPHEPALVCLEYMPKVSKKEAPVLLVGKGIIYDSGGYGIKPGDYMADMYADMGGSATVVGVLLALAALKVKKQVVGVLPLCENLISSVAFKNGDIYTSRKGVTVEIEHTDAEGRLVLGDALCYGQDKYKPALTLDFATLTGACQYALGDMYTGMLTESAELRARFTETGEKVNDYVWALPFDHLIRKSVDGTRADMTNLSSIKRCLGASTAAAFLARFVKDTKTWVHFDIAGTGMRRTQRRAYDFAALYGSGGMVHTVVEFLEGGAAKK